MNNDPLLDLALNAATSTNDPKESLDAGVADPALDDSNTASPLTQDELKQQAQTTHAGQTKEGAAIQTYGLSQAEDQVRFLKAAWTGLLSQILSRVGDTEENREWLTSITAQLQTSAFQSAFFGVQLVELYNYYVNGQRPIDMGSLFVMNDFMRGFKNHVGSIPQQFLNVWDMDTAGASSDPRLGFTPLPVSQLMADPANMRIPVKVETFTDIMYGYLEMFRFGGMVGDKPMNYLTNQPALRIKDNYVAPNSIYRWCEVDIETVKQAWYQGRSIVKKKIPDTAKTSNPIEDTPSEGNVTDENS
jgi:hypothetical protein